MAVIAAPAAVLWPFLAPVKLLNRTLARRLRTLDTEAVLALDLKEKYGPLNRLLGEEDLCFLEGHAGFRPEMRRRLQMDRLRISRSYLRSLATDFQLIQAAGRGIALRGGVGRAEMLEVLARREFSFFFCMAAAEVKSHLYRYGWRGVNLTAPLEVVRDMQSDVRGWRVLATD